MKGDSTRILDGNRHRCLICGHPQREHRASECTVPKCGCSEYTMRGLKGQAASS
jgi:hypothetical protein